MCVVQLLCSSLVFDDGCESSLCAAQMGAATRVRDACAFATHKFFNDRGFLYIHTPLITASDCEGAGEMFQVTTLLPEDPKVRATTLIALALACLRWENATLFGWLIFLYELLMIRF